MVGLTEKAGGRLGGSPSEDEERAPTLGIIGAASTGKQVLGAWIQVPGRGGYRCSKSLRLATKRGYCRNRGLKPPLHFGVSAVGKPGIAAGGNSGGRSVPLCAAFLEK